MRCCWDNKGFAYITSSSLTTSPGKKKPNTSKSVFSPHSWDDFAPNKPFAACPVIFFRGKLLLVDYCAQNPVYLLEHVHDAMLLQRTDLNAGASLFVSLSLHWNSDANASVQEKTPAPHWLDGSAHAMTTGYTKSYGLISEPILFFFCSFYWQMWTLYLKVNNNNNNNDNDGKGLRRTLCVLKNVQKLDPDVFQWT